MSPVCTIFKLGVTPERHLSSAAINIEVVFPFATITNPTFTANEAKIVLGNCVNNIPKIFNNMFTKVCVLLLAIGLSQAVRQPMLPESNLMQFMMRSRDLTQDNPARSLSCFDTYLPQLNKANEDFQTAYALCLSEADASRAGIDEGTKGERAQIDGSATSACQALDACSKLSPSIDYFSCYSDAVSEIFDLEFKWITLIGLHLRIYRALTTPSLCTRSRPMPLSGWPSCAKNSVKSITPNMRAPTKLSATMWSSRLPSMRTSIGVWLVRSH